VRSKNGSTGTVDVLVPAPRTKKHLLLIDQTPGRGDAAVGRAAVIDQTEHYFAAIDSTLGIDLGLRQRQTHPRALSDETRRPR